MLDAFGKPESGILDGNFKWLGSYDECIHIGAAVNRSGAITYAWKGEYCTTQFSLDKVFKVTVLFIYLFIPFTYYMYSKLKISHCQRYSKSADL